MGFLDKYEDKMFATAANNKGMSLKGRTKKSIKTQLRILDGETISNGKGGKVMSWYDSDNDRIICKIGQNKVKGKFIKCFSKDEAKQTLNDFAQAIDDGEFNEDITAEETKPRKKKGS